MFTPDTSHLPCFQQQNLVIDGFWAGLGIYSPLSDLILSDLRILVGVLSSVCGLPII